MQLHKPRFRKFNVCTKLEYIDPTDGKQKTAWYQTGTMRIYEETGSIMIRRFDNPSVDYYCFEQTGKTQADETPAKEDQE